MWSEASREAAALAHHAMAKGQQLREAAHQTGVYQALTKDRFVNAVPPGSNRDWLVKQAAGTIRSMGEKAALTAIGGPMAGFGYNLASYTHTIGQMYRERQDYKDMAKMYGSHVSGLYRTLKMGLQR